MHKFGGTWSESKLDCIERYTVSYLQVMQNQTWCKLDYVDAFAGRGKQELKNCVTKDSDFFWSEESDRDDTNEFLIGSTVRALRASASSKRSFDHFEFVEADPASCKELRSIIECEFNNVINNIKIVCNDANSALRNYINMTNWNDTRALVFLDPYGLEVEWELLKKLSETEACDVWYLFPLGGVLRMMTGNGDIPDSWIYRLDRLFGTHDWYGEFYRSNPQMTLFGIGNNDKIKDASTKNVVKYIRERLLKLFKKVSEAAVLRNSKGAPLFALVLGVSSPSEKAQKAALRIANHLVKDLGK